MSSSFGKNLSKLRKANNISQRQAAADLKISQALLSHYENGVREPKLEFVVKVSDYFGVSTDFILGRTEAHRNPFMLAERSGETGALEAAEKRKRSIVAAQSALISLLACANEESALSSWLDCLESEVYRLISFLKSLESAGRDCADRENISDGLTRTFLEIADAKARAQIEEGLTAFAAEKGEEIFTPSFDEFLKKNYPNVSKNIDEVLSGVEGRIDDARRFAAIQKK